jgi:hypothetical protein
LIPTQNILDTIHFTTTQLHGRSTVRDRGPFSLGSKDREKKLELGSSFLITPDLMKDLSDNARIGISLGQALAGMPVLTFNDMGKDLKDLIKNYRPRTIYSFAPGREGFELAPMKEADAVHIGTVDRNGCEYRSMPEIRKGKDVLKLNLLLDELVDLPLIYHIDSQDITKDIDFILVSGIDSILIDSTNRDIDPRPDVKMVTSLIKVRKQMEMFKSSERDVKVIANGPLRDTNDMLKYMALGADLIGIDDITRAFLRAYLSFRTGESDIDDQDLVDRDGELDWAEIGEIFGEFIRYLIVDIDERMSYLNIDPRLGMNKNDIDTSDYNTASITGLTLQGFGAPVPIWRHRS